MPMHDQRLQEKKVKLADLAIARSLWPLISPYAWMLAVSTFLVFAVTSVELLMPWFIQKGIDGFIIPVLSEAQVELFGVKIQKFHQFGIIFAATVIIGFILEFFQVIFMEYTGQKIIYNLRTLLFRHMAFLPVSYFDKNSSGRLVSRVTGDIENMNEMFTSILIFIFKDLMLMTGILIILFSINTGLAFKLSLMVPVIFLSIALFSRVSRQIFRTIRQKIAEINHSFSEAINGIKIIQTAGRQARFFQRFEMLNREHFKAALTQIRVFAVFMPFIGFLGVASVAIIIYTGSSGIIDKTLTFGELVAFLTYMKLFFRPLRDLSEKFNLLQNALASAERIMIILQLPGTDKSRDKKEKLSGTLQTVSFDHVHFSYEPEKKVLDDVSFILEKGRSIGIVGQTGSGKSTIINLITGFYPHNTGSILFNGTPIRNLDISDLRNRTALVMQDPLLFSGTVRQNIFPDNPDADDDVMLKALDQANCQFLFEKFDGLDTIIKEGGRPLSSGEKQLLCIARAFARDPDLIIFDEATSYMDSYSELKIHAAMQKLMQGRLSIIIAHRLSTVRECDRILLLKNGQIQEAGTHLELVKKKGAYFHLLLKEKT